PLPVCDHRGGVQAVPGVRPPGIALSQRPRPRVRPRRPGFCAEIGNARELLAKCQEVTEGWGTVSDEHPTTGGDELLSLAQIVQRYGVSRTTLHTWRSQGVFPAPEQAPGSTRLRWRK